MGLGVGGRGRCFGENFLFVSACNLNLWILKVGEGEREIRRKNIKERYDVTCCFSY